MESSSIIYKGCLLFQSSIYKYSMVTLLFFNKPLIINPYKIVQCLISSSFKFNARSISSWTIEHEISIMVMDINVTAGVIQQKLMVNPLNGIDFKHQLETRCLINHQTTLEVPGVVHMVLDIFQEATLQNMAK